MPQANLTRFGPQSFRSVPEREAPFSASFRAIEGSAKLVLHVDGATDAQVKLNGDTVFEAADADGGGESIVAINLGKENTIEVGVTGGELGVRVTQVTEAELGLQRQGYFGLNTSDLERQRAFYEMMGFVGEIYPAGPETSTTFARSLGFEDDYLIYVSLHSLEDPPTMPFVDTVQFRGDSYRSEPPYPNLNHIGMAYATYATADLDVAYEYLLAQGVEFVSAPTTAPNGERFAFMKEADGTFWKLLDSPGESDVQPGANLLKLVNTNMNVTDLERSREFYRLLGFTETAPGDQAGGGEFAAAHGF